MLSSELPPPPAPVAVHASVNRDARIRLNTIGFVPDAPKEATIAGRCDGFRIVNAATGAVAFEGHASAPQQTASSDTDETVQIVDFSALSAPGEYRLEVDGIGNSDTFRIDPRVWNEPFAVVSRAMYLWRCGTAVETTWHGVTYHHDACHMEDAYLDLVGGGHSRVPSTGGWHDAGDYNKYVVNAGVSVGFLLKAYEQFGDRTSPISAGIPESTDRVPDLLNEARWEIEWLLTMQLDDGRVYHKLSAPDFKYWGPPDRDTTTRYFAPWSTAATADFVAMTAEAARDWRAFDPAFADRCLAAARKSWAFLVAHPTPVIPNLSQFHTGTYIVKDPPHRLWAAAELWETTGDADCLAEFEKRAADFKVSQRGPGYDDEHDFAIATYLFSSRPGRNPALVQRFTREAHEQARKIVRTSQQNGYRRPFGVERSTWFWGDNGQVAAQTFILLLADHLKSDPAYRATAHDALSYLFGRNYHGRSYVTGLGARPPEHPHDRRGEPAWPGYLVGGPWPDAKHWEDDFKNYRVNEIAINWNTPLIFALAAFAQPAP